LNQIAAHFLNATSDIVPNWLRKCRTRMSASVSNARLIRWKWWYEAICGTRLAGVFKAGKREVCGVALPDGLKENDKLPQPVITPTTKAHEGHDEDISVVSKSLLRGW
jgi:phosphoribosylaminoimidazole-succinocarboxamide synthase